MKTVAITPFRGLNNRLQDFELAGEEGAWLKAAVNVDIDNAGRVRRRDGAALVQAMTGAHSLYLLTATYGFLVRASVLYEIDLSAGYAETLLKLLSTDGPVSYAEYNGSVYYSNGTDSGRIEGGEWFPWGMETPAAPIVSAVAGTMPAGKYQVAVQYYNETTGEAGGVSPSNMHELASAGALRVTLPSATAGATHIRIYVSRLNGSQVYQYDVIATGTTTVDIVGTDGTETTGINEYIEPLPPGTSLFFHMGRQACVSGSRLYYSPSYRFGYYDPAAGYIDFEDDIAIAIANQFGVYVATSDKTYWLAGDLGTVEMLSEPLPYGAVAGTAFAAPHKPVVGWFGSNGFVLGDQQGQVQAVSQDAVDVTVSGTPYVGVFETNGYRRVVSMGYCLNLETEAVTTYDDFAFTSIHRGYGTKADGLYSFVSGADIDARISLGRLSFSTENLKHMPSCYLGVASETPMRLRVLTADGDDYTYDARSSDTNLRTQRIDVGRGLRSNWMEIEVYNSQGAPFVLAEVRFAPYVSKRRI